MRDKRRYLLVRVFPGCLSYEQKDLYLAVQDAVTSVWGDVACCEDSGGRRRG